MKELPLLDQIRACTVCQPHLPHQVRPVLSYSAQSKIIIIGQAPGARVQASGIPWHDKSGINLRRWLGVNEEQFYHPDNFAILPMGFCYPGKGKSGDLPPRKECAPLWHDLILDQISNHRLTLLIGTYAQKYYLGPRAKRNLTATVRQFEDYLPSTIVLPHPSPRNFHWMNKNPWFELDLLPILQAKVTEALQE